MADKFGIRREGLAIMRNSDGKFIIQDGGHVLLEQGGTEYALQSQGGTDRVLIQENCCCGDKCGECTDTIPDDITLDLGVTNFHTVPAGYGFGPGNNTTEINQACSPKCEEMEGTYILTAVNPGLCVWQYSETLCDSSVYYSGVGTVYRLYFSARIFWSTSTYTWSWTVLVNITEQRTGFPETLVFHQTYEKSTTTICTGKTFTLDRMFDSALGNFSLCYTGSWNGGFTWYLDNVWEWPATIDLIIP